MYTVAMLELLTFLLISILFMLGYMGAIKALWAMMQDGGAFDVAFKWSKLRDRLYASKKPIHRMLEFMMGGCEQCTSFWWSLPWTILYFTFCKSVGVWVLSPIQSMGWVIVFWSICSMFGLWVLTNKNKHQ